MPVKDISPSLLSRAQGCLLGQLSGDALGSLVEFQSPDEIRQEYPTGVRELAAGGTWNTIAGQPTDDSEMALALARTLVERSTYDPDRARAAYVTWLESQPFDCGTTILCGLSGRPNQHSQANGALMRVSPLGIYGAHSDLQQVARWAEQDAAITHPHLLCQQVNALFAMAVAYAVSTKVTAWRLVTEIDAWAKSMAVTPVLLDAIADSFDARPRDYLSQQGWVLIAFQNALYQLLHARNLEEGVVDTVMRGGDTDTNAAIAGALFGAVYGIDAVPQQWMKAVLSCRPDAANPDVQHPRPSCYWPVDALQLAEQLVVAGAAANGDSIIASSEPAL